MELMYLRELQSGTAAESLKQHVIAMQAPVQSDASIELLQTERSRLEAEVGELRRAQQAWTEHEAFDDEESDDDSAMPHPF
eukprot:6019542-Alexandrium_andersonii.AAC.1